MNENEFDRAARAWLDDGPTRMSDRAVLSALEEIHTTRQRRVVWPAWRAAPVSNFARLATAAVLVVAVGLLAGNVVLRQPDGSSVGGPPTPSSTDDPTPSPSPSPSAAVAVDFPNPPKPSGVTFDERGWESGDGAIVELTTTFVSPRNGFSMMRPARAAVTRATGLWGSPEDEDGFDVVETGLYAVFAGASMDITRVDNGGFIAGSDGVPIDEWIDDVIDDRDGCGVPRSQQAEITIDGQSGRISECANRIEATVVTGGRLYFFTLPHNRSDARAVFDAFAATIDLTPETAVDVPALTTTFESPTYGYSFGYIDRGGLAPATELWDPVSQQLNIDSDDRFDAVETGLAAYLEGASTPIPDGVSIDDWVDEYVTPVAAGGCGVPRSRQAEITIDGQSGRIAECQNGIQGTVVAGGRLYLFILSADRRDARAFFDTWVATIDLTPETAAAPGSVYRVGTTSPSEVP